MKDHWAKTLEKIIAFLMTIIMAFIAWESTKWSTAIENLSGNVSALNTKMEVVITQLSDSNQQFQHLEKRVDDHDVRLRKVEERKK